MTVIEEHPADQRQLVTPTCYVICTAEDGSPEWHAARREGMGGSDVPIALGMNKNESPLKIYLEKRGELPDLPRSEQLQEAGEFGRDMQDVIANRWAIRSGYSWEHAPGTLAHVEQDWMRVNVDGICYDHWRTPGVLEIKNRSEYQLDEWEDGVPAAPAIQAHWGMAITGYSYAVVAALVGGNKLRWHRIERDQDLIDNLVTLVAGFWRGVLAGREPAVDTSKATTTLIGQLYGVDPGKVASAERSEVEPLLEERARLKAEVKAAETALRGVENQLKKQAGHAEVIIGDGEDHTELYSFKANGTFAHKRFREAHPDLAREYTHQVPAIDDKRLAMEHPEIYSQFRARVLRVPAPERTTK